MDFGLTIGNDKIVSNFNLTFDILAYMPYFMRSATFGDLVSYEFTFFDE
jgi:hypothetical protein